MVDEDPRTVSWVVLVMDNVTTVVVVGAVLDEPEPDTPLPLAEGDPEASGEVVWPGTADKDPD